MNILMKEKIIEERSFDSDLKICVHQNYSRVLSYAFIDGDNRYRLIVNIEFPEPSLISYSIQNCS